MSEPEKREHLAPRASQYCSAGIASQYCLSSATLEIGQDTPQLHSVKLQRVVSRKENTWLSFREMK